MTVHAIPWGRCGVCLRAYHLTDKGLIRVHRAGRRTEETCPGSSLPPVAVMS